MGSEEQCRKQLPNRQQDANSPSSMSESKEKSRRKDRSTGKKRVMFDDQKQSSHQQNDDNVRKDLFTQSDQNYQMSHGNTSGEYASESDPQSLEKYPKKAADYDHFHDESMSKLEAVLQRQRERLENLGGFSGKSSQLSNGQEGRNEEEKGQYLEEAYQDLEEEIYNIKKNLEASQTSEGYSPMKLNARNMDDSGMKDAMDLSPSDLQYEEE